MIVGHRPTRHLVFSARVDPRLRASPRPLRVLAARRRLQDRQAGGARRGVRAARARADRSRRHERRRGALQGLQEARHQADPGPRGVLRGRPRGARGQDRAQPPDADRAERRRLPQSREALQRRVPRGALPRQAGRGHGAAVPARRGRDRAVRLPGEPKQPPDRRGPARRGPRAPGRAGPGVRARGRLLRDPAQRRAGAGEGQRGDPALRAGDGPAARRHGGRPLPAPGGLPPPRGAAVRADQVHAGRAEDVLRHQRVLLEELAGDGGVLRRDAGGAGLDAGDRGARGRRDRARQAADPALRLPGRQGREGLPARAGARRPARALRRPAARRGGRADGDGARRHRQDGLQRLLPDRLGLRRLREEQRDRGRPGPRLRRPAASSPTACGSRTSTRSATTCCSSASSTPSACRCPTSTSTSPCAAASA